jgi:hypothetical protein
MDQRFFRILFKGICQATPREAGALLRQNPPDMPVLVHGLLELLLWTGRAGSAPDLLFMLDLSTGREAGDAVAMTRAYMRRRRESGAGFPEARGCPRTGQNDSRPILRFIPS